jgi:hypothetical protein
MLQENEAAGYTIDRRIRSWPYARRNVVQSSVAYR